MKKVLVRDFERYRLLCIRYSLFTRGSIFQYERVNQMMRDRGLTISTLALLTYMCSDNYTLQQIEVILSAEFAPY